MDFHETLLLKDPLAVKRVRPLEVNPGGIMVTDSRLYFRPLQASGLGEGSLLQIVELREVYRLYKRRHLLRSNALELITQDGNSSLFCFHSVDERDQVMIKYELTMTTIP